MKRGRASHSELIGYLARRYPLFLEKAIMLLDFSMSEVEEMLLDLTRFDISTPFSVQRAEFTFQIIEAKRAALLRELGL
jgi:hypothetical protein